MSNRDRVLEFLRSIAPTDATNAEIVARTGIKPHQQIFMITHELKERGLVKAIQAGKEWRFWWDEGGRHPTSTRAPQQPDFNGTPHPWDDATTIEYHLGMTWEPMGRVVLSQDGRLQFPAAPQSPALYRFRVRRAGGAATYVGETENLARRFALYRNPGPSQLTNLRLNGNFRNALAAGAEIAVSAVTSDAWIERYGSREAADLSSKAIRRLLENAALLDGAGAAVESLNR